MGDRREHADVLSTAETPFREFIQARLSIKLRTPALDYATHADWGKAVRRLARWLASRPPFSAFARLLMRRGIVRRRVWKAPRDGSIFFVSAFGSRFRYQAVSGDEILRALYWTGLETWESETLRTYARLASHARVVIDVGSYTGVYTLLACAVNPGVYVLAVEPHPGNFQIATRNIELNGWETRCRVVNAAAGATRNAERLWLPPTSVPSGGRLIPPTEEPPSEGTTLVVPIVSVDSLAASTPNVDLVKIDVEGTEDHVLAGMTRLLERARPSLILECLPTGPITAVAGILNRFGYALYHLRGKGPVRVEAIEPDPSLQFRNFLAVGRPGIRNALEDWAADPARLS